MPSGISPGTFGEGHQEDPVECQALRITELIEAEGHGGLAVLRLGSVRAKDPVPPRKVESEVAVRFVGTNRVVNEMHVRSHEDQPEKAIQSGRHAEIAMVEHGGRV